ncbi:MAG: M1 family metallopeptidase [Chloroflexota bacterium]|nr:M1 family metallopeptidase [Chloroflexota bacterium]
MKPITFIRTLILCALILAACSTPQAEPAPIPTQVESAPTPSPTLGITLSPTMEPSPTASLTPTAAPLPQLQYVISANLDYAYHHLYASQSISIPNLTNESFSELMLVVQPNWHSDIFHLLDISWEDGSPVENYSLDGIRLLIPLDEALPPGEALTLSLNYELALPPLVVSDDIGPTPFGYTTRQINLVDWYPFVPPYEQGQGWVVHNPWFYGEHLVYPMADFDVSVSLSNAPDGTIIAASALDIGDDESHRYHLEQGRNFVWSVSPSYHVFEQQVGATTVLGYVFYQYTSPGEAAFDATVDALKLYSEIYGTYPYDSLTMVEADFMHGMEYQGLHFLSRGFFDIFDDSVENYLISIAAHETAHQWWYGMVGNDQALEPWLDEALATYSERLFYEHLYPDSLDWWWYARVSYYHPSGWVDSVLHYTDGYLPYRDAVYLRGALFMEDLRTSIGDEAFFAFLRDYADTYRYQIVTRDDFFGLLAEHTDADLTELLAMYFEK